MKILGYKVFNEHWMGEGLKYEVGQTYEIEEKPICGEVGFHFCKELVHCFKYYDFHPKNKVAIIEVLGDIDGTNLKQCTNKIKIVKELSWSEVLTLVNIGENNTGKCNTGDNNSGDYNSGNSNSGYSNTGDGNTGDYNTGNENSGHYNSGNYNTSNHNSGWFNTKSNKIFLFNKLSDLTYDEWTETRGYELLTQIPKHGVIWQTEDEMTEIEKRENPGYKRYGGVAKIIKATNHHKQLWFDSLNEEDKQAILNIPNFNPEIFEDLTGINV